MFRLSSSVWSVSIALLTTFVAETCAEIIFPGVETGIYHVDRWGQGTFSYLFVDPGLHEQLAPFLGSPIRLNAKDVLQPINPGSGILRKVEAIERLPSLVKIEIAWEPQPNNAATPNLLRIRAGGSARINATVTNISGLPVPLADSALFVAVREHRPCATGASRVYEPLGFWSQRQSLNLDWSFSESLCYCEAPHYLRTLKEEIRFKGGEFWIHRVLERETAPVIAPGKSLTWTIPLTHIPANEYELAIAFDQWRILRDGDGQRLVRSNWLRLDALLEKSESWDGLQVDLRRGGSEERDGKRKLNVVFRNVGSDQFRVTLRKNGNGKANLSDALLFYDAEGTLLRKPPEKMDFDAITVALAPDQEHIVEVNAPDSTVLARVAWLNNFETRSEKGAPRSLPYGYYLSQHLALGDDVKAEPGN